MPANTTFLGYIMSSERQVVALFKANFHVQLAKSGFQILNVL